MKLLNTIRKSLAKKRLWAFLFSRGQMEAGTSQTATNVPTREQYMSNLYTSLFKLPLQAWIDIVVEGDLSALELLKMETPSDILMEVFDSLSEEYAKLSENEEVAYIQKKKQQLEELTLRILRLNSCNLVLSASLSGEISVDEIEPVLKYLNACGIKGSFENMFNLIETRLKNMNFQLGEIEFELSKEKASNGKATRADYAKIIAISNKNGYKVSYDMSTADFIQVMNCQRQEKKELDNFKNNRK